MANSLPLPSAEQLAGTWQLTLTTADHVRHTSRVSLEARAHAEPNTYALHFADDHVQRASGATITGWRPAPDGIALTDQHAMTVLFLAKAGHGYDAALNTGARAVLTPLTSHP